MSLRASLFYLQDLQDLHQGNAPSPKGQFLKKGDELALRHVVDESKNTNWEYKENHLLNWSAFTLAGSRQYWGLEVLG